jgi:OOP family OmpA-OmpF porin
MKYLISRGVDAGQLKARGYGGVQPIADNSTWAGLVSNRRVELHEIH